MFCSQWVSTNTRACAPTVPHRDSPRCPTHTPSSAHSSSPEATHSLIFPCLHGSALQDVLQQGSPSRDLFRLLTWIRVSSGPLTVQWLSSCYHYCSTVGINQFIHLPIKGHFGCHRLQHNQCDHVFSSSEWMARSTIAGREKQVWFYKGLSPCLPKCPLHSALLPEKWGFLLIHILASICVSFRHVDDIVICISLTSCRASFSMFTCHLYFCRTKSAHKFCPLFDLTLLFYCLVLKESGIKNPIPFTLVPC